MVEKELSHADFCKCLFDVHQFEHEFSNIRSKSHKVTTSRQKKLSLSPFDDKRYLLDNVFSLPYGHYRINNC